MRETQNPRLLRQVEISYLHVVGDAYERRMAARSIGYTGGGGKRDLFTRGKLNGGRV